MNGSENAKNFRSLSSFKKRKLRIGQEVTRCNQLRSRFQHLVRLISYY